MADVTIEYTGTARSTLLQLRNHLIACGVAPLPVIECIIDEFESKVSAFPVGCQLCPELLKIGSDRYRECNTQKDYRYFTPSTGFGFGHTRYCLNDRILCSFCISD
ncbi:hypothetical protein ERHA55_52250 (plasmid) [Erwinia rhapontici]|nr:hypothetical protein ERHA55_52250 [Erwinia rhapontici]